MLPYTTVLGWLGGETDVTDSTDKQELDKARALYREVQELRDLRRSSDRMVPSVALSEDERLSSENPFFSSRKIRGSWQVISR
jgi:hypothetical protein